MTSIAVTPEPRRPARRTWRYLAAAVIAVLVVVPLALAGHVFLEAIERTRTLPPDLGKPSLTLLDARGEAFATRGRFVGPAIRPEALPEPLTSAVLAIEDRRFHDHFGIDIRGLLRAAWTNLRAGHVRQGGSSITQQLVKLTYLDPTRSFSRKLDELFLALALERHLSKQEILAHYLDRVYFGAGATGAEGAARRYFSKRAEELSLAEAALLAGLIRAPTATAPTVAPEAARARAALVLDTMVETGAITADAAAAAKASPAVLRPGPEDGGSRGWFADWVAEAAAKQLPAGTRQATLRTTLDPGLQGIAERLIARTFGDRPQLEGADQVALVALAPDGAVVAMIGGRDYAKSQFNRAAKAMRQPGSAFKAFVFLTALEQGMTPDSIVTDGRIRLGDWAPENINGTYQGDMTAEAAFAQSVNTVAIHINYYVGPEKVAATARRLGVNADIRPTPSLGLGTSELTPLDLATAYGTFPAGGVTPQPYGLVALDEQAMPPAPRSVTVARPVNDHMLRLLTAVMTQGTGRSAQFGWPAGGKTGTSQDYRDAWFVGFTKDLTVVVWVGNDDNSPTQKVTGSGLPARIWREFMREAHADGRFGRRERARPLVAAQPPPPAPRPAQSPIDRVGEEIRRLFR